MSTEQLNTQKTFSGKTTLLIVTAAVSAFLISAASALATGLTRDKGNTNTTQAFAFLMAISGLSGLALTTLARMKGSMRPTIKALQKERSIENDRVANQQNLIRLAAQPVRLEDNDVPVIPELSQIRVLGGISSIQNQTGSTQTPLNSLTASNLSRLGAPQNSVRTAAFAEQLSDLTFPQNPNQSIVIPASYVPRSGRTI